MCMASKIQKLASPFIKSNKPLTYIYYNVVLKNEEIIPLTLHRFYRYMRIDTSNYEKQRAEFVASQLAKMADECTQRNRKRREVKRKALFGAPSPVAAEQAAADETGSAAESAAVIPELAEQL